MNTPSNLANSLQAAPPEHGGVARLRQTVAAVAWVAAATAAALVLDRHVTLAVLALVYLAAVVTVSYRSTFFASALAATLTVLCLNFFFVPPRLTFTVHATENVLTLAALLGVAMLVSSMASRLRADAARAMARERKARDLQRLASQLSDLDEEAAILDAVQRSLARAAPPAALAAVSSADGVRLASAGTELAESQRDAVLQCHKSGRALGPGTGQWDQLPDWYLPLRAGEESFGVLVAPAGDRTQDDRKHLQTIADLAAGALRRARHASAAVSARREAESQALRSALLAAVSHDFRTPLASIVGAVSSLKDQDERLDAATRRQLLSLIGDEAQHLNAMAENTLQWLRLSSAAPTLRLDWQSMEEIIGTVLSRVRRRDPARRIKVQVPGQLPLVRADAALLAQLLENLLDNALRYSDRGVELQVTCDEQELQVHVMDRGEGIHPDELPKLFDSFFRGAAAQGTRGSGLGLAVARAVALAHGGALQVSPRESGGSRFTLRLPAGQAPAVPMEGAA